MPTGVVRLAHGEHSELVSSALHARDTFWVSGQVPEWKKHSDLSCRYRHGMEPVPVEVVMTGDSLKVHFNEPQRGLQCGQVKRLHNEFLPFDWCVGR